MFFKHGDIDTPAPAKSCPSIRRQVRHPQWRRDVFKAFSTTQALPIRYLLFYAIWQRNGRISMRLDKHL